MIITENARPAWGERERLVLGAHPRLVIGNDADSAYHFRQIRGVMLFADGRIAVADGGSLQLRLFSAQRRFLAASAGKGAGLAPVWRSPVGVFAASEDRFYAGFGDWYEVRVYTVDGPLASIIRRAWTPTPITEADWEDCVAEWSKSWVGTTGAERERDIQQVRESPWAVETPTFSEFVPDRGGRLWVREAHRQDAIAAGSLTDIPAVPSAWSVFDANGRLLGDVAMPVGLRPFEIGSGYVAGVLRTNGRNQIAIYDLRARDR